MLAEVISIGDELTSGQRLDTNTQWLSQRLAELGIRTLAHTTISDDLPANVEVFRIASNRADIVICTGGLGPTKDDLTREALATAFDLPLIEDPQALAHIEALFQRRNRPMPERNKCQALFPQGSRSIHNPHGTAPGIDLTISVTSSATLRNCRIFALPGVPAEMKQMWDETVAPRLINELGAGKRMIQYAIFKCFGIGESEVEVRMPDLISRDRVPRVGITASRATITLRVAAEGNSAEECLKQLAPTAQEIRDRLGPIVYAEVDEELPDTVIKMLLSRRETIATIEYGAASLLGSWLTEAGNRLCSADNKPLTEVYCGSLSAPDSKHLRVVAASSSESLPDIACAIRAKFGTDWLVAVGPYPQVSLSTPADVQGAIKLQVVICGSNGVINKEIEMSGHPDVVQHRIAKSALDQLRYALLAEPPG